MELERYKSMSGKTYRDIGSQLRIHWSGVWHAVNKPGRCSLQTVLDVGAVIGAPEDVARRQWLDDKKRRAAERLERQAQQ